MKRILFLPSLLPPVNELPSLFVPDLWVFMDVVQPHITNCRLQWLCVVDVCVCVCMCVCVCVCVVDVCVCVCACVCVCHIHDGVDLHNFNIWQVIVVTLLWRQFHDLYTYHFIFPPILPFHLLPAAWHWVRERVMEQCSVTVSPGEWLRGQDGNVMGHAGVKVWWVMHGCEGE